MSIVRASQYCLSTQLSLSGVDPPNLRITSNGHSAIW